MMFAGKLKKILLLSMCCWQFAGGVLANEYEALAVWWAPTVEQSFIPANNAAQAYPAQHDTFTLFNFDLDWRANNNWDNLSYYMLKPPVLYYSVVAGRQFYYLGYYLFYPRHLGGSPHGNDFVGMVMAVKKTPGNGQGQPAGALLYDGTGWQEVNLRKLQAAGNSVVLAVSAGEHELALKETANARGGNVLLCKPAGKAAADQEVAYELTALNELWQHREEIAAGAASGTLDYKTGGGGELKNFPWKWRYRGKAWLSDPAAVFRAVTGDAEMSGDYTYNPFTE